MKKLSKKTIIVVIAIISIIVISLIGTVLYLSLSKDVLVFKLNGNDKMTLEVYSEYEELGVTATLNDEDISSEVTIDNSNIDINKLGTYQVTYILKHDEEEIKLTREVEVVDSTSPTITLNGASEVTVKKGTTYQELGCSAVDNYDEKVKDKIQIINNVNTSLPGLYEVKYVVSDESGNTATLIRTVVVVENNTQNTNIKDIVLDSMESNEIKSMKFTNDGIYVDGYIKDNNGTFKVILCDDKEKCTIYGMTKMGDYNFFGNIKLTGLNNGTYTVYVESNNKEKAINKQEMQHRIVRAKVGDKLVSFSYDNNNNIKLKIEDFAYQYDIVIDPGHGGSDPGALNQYIDEKNINLIQSKYEKQRYEEHGLKVLLLREDLTYGTVMGDSSWPAVRRKAYAIGYYGAVSRFSYSNHHNSSDDKSLMGWEIIVPANSDISYLSHIYQIRDAWSNLYPTTENHVRLYTRNYNTSVIFTKENEEKYSFTDYYAVIRLPQELYNVNHVLFEGAYLSNLSDYDWYYNKGNWKKLSEEKIKAYVTALGIDYKEPE